MWKKCTPLWREAHFQIKMLKKTGVRTTFGGSDVASLHYTTLHYMILHYTTLHNSTTTTTQLHNYTPLHSTTLHYITLHYTPQQYNYNYTTTQLHSTTLHYTKLHYTTLVYTTLHYTTLHYTTTTTTTATATTTTSSTAQGGGGSFKNRTPIGELLLWIRDGRAKPLMDWKVIDLFHSFSLFLNFSLCFSIFLWLSTDLPL